VLPHWQAPTDPEGRLRLRGLALADGFVIADDAGRWQWQPIDPEAGLLTRDRVRLETSAGHTWLHFQGRESGWVKILGELVHLAPLQARLDALALAAGWPAAPVLLARPDPRAETALILVFEGDPPGQQTLIDHFHAGQPPWLRLQRVVSLHELPRSDLGKIRLAELDQLLGR
jgi:O-succinylbenzoic acid--CoA ligase